MALRPHEKCSIHRENIIISYTPRFKLQRRSYARGVIVDKDRLECHWIVRQNCLTMIV